jgi:hypothetical protein
MAVANILFIAVAVILFAQYIPIVKDAYAHGVSSGGSGALRINNEQFSDNTIDKDEILVIRGTLQSIVNREITLSPYVSVSTSEPFRSSELQYLLRNFYPLYNDPANWYFRIEYNVSTPIVLKPGEQVDYEIKAYPLKAGIYHIHTFLVSDDRYSYNKHLSQFVARGQTVVVTGSSVPTMGEITQLYLPFAIGAVTLSFLILGTRRIAKQNHLGKVRKGIRIYFAVKAAIETVWLWGILFWLAMAAYPILYPLETRLVSVLSMTAIIAAITAGSYFAAVAKSQKVQRVVAIATAGASAVFCFLLLFGDIDDGGFGYNRAQFDVNGLILLIAIIVNSIIAILALVKRSETHKSRRFTSEIPSRQ